MSAKELQALTQKFADAFDQRDLQPILDMLSEDVEVFDHVPYRFDGKALFAKYLNEVIASLASASFGFRQPSCRMYSDQVGIVNANDMTSVPNIGTIVPTMGTTTGALWQVLFGHGRRSILALLYGHADEQFYLREIARRAGTGIGATQRELGQLTDAGILHRVRRGNQVYYQANRKNPIFAELKSILAKTSGIRDILHEALTSVKDRIKLAFVYGSIARGEEKASSDVDLMVVGEMSFADVVSALAKIETKLGREVNPTVYGPREFREKLSAKNHFLATVAKEKKLFVIGDEREFRRLGQERLARRA